MPGFSVTMTRLFRTVLATAALCWRFESSFGNLLVRPAALALDTSPMRTNAASAPVVNARRVRLIGMEAKLSEINELQTNNARGDMASPDELDDSITIPRNCLKSHKKAAK